jgi:two-component system, NarL family, sensor histidine kinase UhpB
MRSDHGPDGRSTLPGVTTRSAGPPPASVALRDAGLVAASTALYLVGARVAIVGFGGGDTVEPLWIATAGCAALALALSPRRSVAVVIGAMIGELLNSVIWFGGGAGDTAAAVIANGSTLTVALVLFRRIIGPVDGIVRVRQGVRWLAAATVAAGTGALIDAIWMFGEPESIESPLRWWLGDSVGLILIAPLGLWARHPFLRPPRGWYAAELGSMLALLAACSAFAVVIDAPFMYLSVPIIGWLALRYGLRASAVSATLVAIWSTIAAGRGAGGFTLDGPDPVLQVQAYNIAVGLTEVIIGALATRVHREQQELERAQRDREVLERRLAAVRTEERHRIAQRLHDDAIQVLVAADLQLAAVRKRSGGEAAPQLGAVAEHLHTAIDELRDAIGSLVPPEMHGDRLVAGLEAVAAGHRAPDGPVVSVDVRLDGHAHGIDNESGTALYQIAREAMANAVVHGRPGHVWVSVTADGRDVTLTVADDGVGLADEGRHADQSSGVLATAERGHLGVRLMHERAMSVGGTVTIGPRPGGGTSLVAVVPRLAPR